jgi:hypothetical protein
LVLLLLVRVTPSQAQYDSKTYTITLITYPNALYTQAIAINDNGDILGKYNATVGNIWLYGLLDPPVEIM